MTPEELQAIRALIAENKRDDMTLMERTAIHIRLSRSAERLLTHIDEQAREIERLRACITYRTGESP